MKLLLTVLPAIFLSLLPASPARSAVSGNDIVYRNRHHYTVADGLSSNRVFGIVQDSIGFIYMGTGNGLCRFDGCEFRTYTHTDDGPGLSSNNIRRLMLDRRGRIWISLDNGADIYDPATDRFTRFDATDDEGTGLEGQTTEIIEDRDGEIWISTTSQGLFRWNPATGKLTRYRHDPDCDTSIAQDYISTLYETEDGTIWVGTYSEGLCAFSKRSGSFIRYRKGPGGLSDNSIDAIAEDSYGNLWLGTVNSGLDRFDRTSGRFTNYNDRSGERRMQYIHCLAETRPGELLVGSESGATLYSFTESGLQPVAEANAPFTNTESRNVYSFLRDREGNFWFGTNYQGAEFHPARNGFTCYATHLSSANGRGRVITAVAELAPGRYLLGTEDNGILLFDEPAASVRPWRTATAVGAPVYNILSLLIDGQTLWIATFQRGIEAVDLKSGRTRTYLNDSSAPHSRIFALCRSSNGRIWAGTSAGLYYYDHRSDRFVEKQSGARISALTEARGRLWIATANDGLYSYDARTDRIKHYLHDRSNPESLCGNAINTLAVDNSDRLWIGTNGRGICRYDESCDRFVPCPEVAPQSRVIQQIVTDDNHLWITTDKGLTAYCPDTGRQKRYSRTDGLHTEQFMPGSGIRATGKRIVLGTTDGICCFTPPHEIANDETLYPAVITRLTLNGLPIHAANDTPALAQAIEHTRRITLPYDKNTLGLRFVSPTFLFPKSCGYRYRLEGFDARPIETDSRSVTVNYNNLGPGSYKFIIEAGNRDGGGNPPSPARTELEIEIRPPFFRSAGALAAYAVLGVVLAGTLLRLLHRRSERKTQRKIARIRHENERMLYEQRLNFFTHIAHEIRTPLSLIIGPLEQVMKSKRLSDTETEWLSVIERNYRRLYTLIGQLLDFRKIDSNNYRLHCDSCDLRALVREQIELFTPTYEQRHIRLDARLPEGDAVRITDRGALTKIVSNLLSNAIRFAVSRAEIRLEIRPGAFIIEVSDDGPGIPPEERRKVFDAFYQASNNSSGTGTGIGLHLCRTFVELLGGQIEAAERPDGAPGALLRLFVPEPENTGNTASKPCEAAPQEESAGGEALRPSGAADETPVPESAAGAARPSVMIVDDNESILDFLAKVLSNDYFVIATSSGQQALDLLRSNAPDLIVSDIMMEGIDGIELCRRVKTDLNTSHIPVILLTARTDVESKIEGLECGADAYLEKPFSSDHLKAQIANLLHKQNELRRHYASKPLSESTPLHNPLDEEFIRKCREVIVAHMSDPELSVGLLARELAMSRTLIFKKLKAITDTTPNDFMKLVRLKEASRMMVEGRYRITEIGFLTGFSSSSYFAKCFAKQFGMLPTEFIEKYKSGQQPTDAA